MGYIKSTDSFNIGKQSEFNERKWFVESKAITDEDGVKDGN